MSESLRVVLAERPKAEIIPGQTFKTEKQPIPREQDLKDGEVLVENLYLSLDPAMRGWLNGAFVVMAPTSDLMLLQDADTLVPRRQAFLPAPCSDWRDDAWSRRLSYSRLQV